MEPPLDLGLISATVPYRGCGTRGRGTPCQKTANQCCNNRCQRRIYGRLLHCLAFWQGWSAMTTGYADQKPCATHFSSATLAMKWSHSVVTEETFLSERGALESARFLSLEVAPRQHQPVLDGSTIMQPCHSQRLAPVRTPRPSQHVGLLTL